MKPIVLTLLESQMRGNLLNPTLSFLLNVYACRAVSILKSCAKTNRITLLISRSAQSQDEFRRLSNSLLLQPAGPTQVKKGTSISLLLEAA